MRLRSDGGSFLKRREGGRLVRGPLRPDDQRRRRSCSKVTGVQVRHSGMVGDPEIKPGFVRTTPSEVAQKLSVPTCRSAGLAAITKSPIGAFSGAVIMNLKSFLVHHVPAVH